MIVEERTVAHAEFWPLTRVLEVVGISKTVLYAQMKLGLFPQSHAYEFSGKRRFWVSNDVKRWQLNQLSKPYPDIVAEIDNEFDELLK